MWEKVLWPQGYNAEGKFLLEFSSTFDLTIVNTFLKKEIGVLSNAKVEQRILKKISF